jgi:hypothetical protein
MIGYYIVPECSHNMKHIEVSSPVMVMPITYVGGCCMGITGMLPPLYPRINILIPYRSKEEAYPNFKCEEVVLTLEEITSWVAYINELGFKCDITNEELITYTDHKNDGLHCEITISAPDKVNRKYNLILLTLLRYMFNRAFRYREIYENAVKINKLLPDVDPVVRLSLAHKLVMTTTENNNSVRTDTTIYSGYYGLFRHSYKSRFLTSKSLKHRLSTLHQDNVNIVFSCENALPSNNYKEMEPHNLKALVDNPTEANLIKLKEIINRNLD